MGRPRQEHHIRVRAIRRAEPDLRRLGRALLELAKVELADSSASTTPRDQPKPPQEAA